jgi:two-component system NarL family response regulator
VSDARIRILLVEDHLLARVGTATLLCTQPDFDLVGEATGGEEGVALFRALRPDVALVDLRMPGLDGLGVIERLATEAPPPRILVLTHYAGDEDVARALRVGALGYLTKDTDSVALFAAVRAVSRGERYLPALLAARVQDRAVTRLSPREQQVLEHIFRGMSNKQIAAALSISEKTVSMFVVRLFAKLGVRSRVEAVTVGIERRLLRAE